MSTSELECPRCTQKMNRTKLGWLCPDCEGCWFAFEQFDRVLRLSDLELKSSEIEPTLEFDKPGVSLEHHVKCPQCELRMKRHVYLLDSGVTVDMCREHGMWLDDGELTKIREFLKKSDDEYPDEGAEPSPKTFFRRLFGGRI